MGRFVTSTASAVDRSVCQPGGENTEIRAWESLQTSYGSSTLTRMTLRLEPIVDGNEAGETLVFFQGWPDTASLWYRAVASLGSTYRCVRVTLPNFAGERAARWGYRTEEIIDALVEVVRDAAKNGPV